MKKAVLLMVWLVMLTTLVKAQTEKGRWMVGAQVGDFQYSDQNRRKIFSGSLTPLVGYFVAKNFLVGTGIPLSLYTGSYYGIRYPDPNIVRFDVTTTQYGVSPFVRYYIGAAKLKPYLGVAYTYSKSHSQTTIPSALLQKSEGFSSAIVPALGVAYFLSRSVALNAGLNFSIQKNEDKILDPQSAASTVTSDFKSVSLGIGFQLFFGK